MSNAIVFDLSPLLLFLQFVRFCTFLLSFLFLISFSYLFVEAFIRFVDAEVPFEDYYFLQFVSAFGIAFCVMMLLAEARVPQFYEKFPSFGYWVVRGLFFFFVAVLLLLVESIVNQRDGFETFIEITAYIMMAFASLYVLLGIFCVKEKAEAEGKGNKNFPDIA